MTYVEILTVVAVGLSVFALANPIQRKLVALLVPRWVWIWFFVIPTGLSIWPEIAGILGYQLLDIPELVVETTTLMLPAVGIAIATGMWITAPIRTIGDAEMIALIHASINEQRFGELSRLVLRNRRKIGTRFSAEVINVLFEMPVLRALNRSPNWIHLDLLRDAELTAKSNNQLGIADAVVRQMFDPPAGLIQGAVAARFGGREHHYLSTNERHLWDHTFSDPHWYIDHRIDYPLLMIAVEYLESGSHGDTVNLGGRASLRNFDLCC